MPAAAAPPAPPSTPATPAPKPASVGSAAPPSGGEIHIGAPASVAEGNPTVTPPKSGSAKARMFEGLRAKAGVPPTPPAPKATDPKPEAPRPGEATPPETPPETKPPDGKPTTPENPEAKPGDPTTAPEAKDGKKPSPWKLVDQFKERATKAEARALELEKQVVPEAKRKETEARIESYEKRIKEMTDDLRYFNAEKYDPDILKANADYEGAWKRATHELGELTVIDAATQQPRAVNSEDILQLVNLPLAQAREAANEIFGDFADDVMAHRKEIRNLFEAKKAKLEELKKNGAERDEQRKRDMETRGKEMLSAIQADFNKETESVLANEKHGKFFKPREGDEEWNTRLEKGFKLVEDSTSVDIYDPRLTPNQRQDAIRKYVAVRNRAAAFEAIRFDYERTLAKLAEVEKKLAGYEASTPGTGGQVTPNTPPVSGRAMDGMMARLRAKARPN